MLASLAYIYSELCSGGGLQSSVTPAIVISTRTLSTQPHRLTTTPHIQAGVDVVTYANSGGVHGAPLQSDAATSMVVLPGAPLGFGIAASTASKMIIGPRSAEHAYRQGVWPGKFQYVPYW